MALRLRPRRHAPPPIWALLVDFWHLSPVMASGFWTAIRAATWTQAVSWRQQLQLFQGLRQPQDREGAHPLLYASRASIWPPRSSSTGDKYWQSQWD